MTPKVERAWRAWQRAANKVTISNRPYTKAQLDKEQARIVRLKTKYEEALVPEPRNQANLCGTHGWQDGRAWEHDYKTGRKVWSAKRTEATSARSAAITCASPMLP